MSEYKQTEDSPYLDNSWLSYLEEKDADNVLSDQNTLVKLRKISSKMHKDNLIVSSLRQAVMNSLLGGEIKFKTVVGGKQNKRALSFLMKQMKAVDKDRDKSISQTLNSIVGTAFEKGDCLVNLPISKSIPATEIQTYVEVIDASRIKTPPRYSKDKSVRLGVRYKGGVVVGYYVRKLKTNSEFSYNQDTNKDFTYFPVHKTFKMDGKTYKRKVCKLYKAGIYQAPDQSRGIPVITPGMNMLRYFDAYMDTVIIGARVSNSFSVFIQTKNPAGTKAAMEANSGINIKNVSTIRPGTISMVSGADSITPATPHSISDNNDQFIRRNLRLQSLLIRFPYEIAFQDLNEINYSSSKFGNNDVERTLFAWGNPIAELTNWVAEAILLEGYIKKIIKTNPNNISVKTILPVLKGLDDEKQARANKTDVLSTKIKTKHDLVDDYEELDAEVTEEALDETRREAKVLALKKELEEEMGIVFPDSVEEKRDTSSSRRPGESSNDDLDEDDARERRIEDGNT